MSESEIRSILRSLCNDLDRRARAMAKKAGKAAIPVTLGAGLALGAGCGDDTDPPRRDAQVETGPQPAYGVPMPDLAMDITPSPDGGAIPPYMAPDMGVDIGGAVPEYMAPGDGGK